MTRTVDDQTDWARILPFLALHAIALGAFATGVSPTALVACALSYALRMFAITAFYHRYFSHRAFSTSRAAQFVFAGLGSAAAQRGPLWWAAHHRIHHRRSDTEGDPHSPRRGGFLRSHVGWFTCRRHVATRLEEVRDFARYPELRFLDRHEFLAPTLYAAGWFALGAALEAWAPGLETTALQMLLWGFFVSTVLVYHVTFTINSLAHRFGTRRFETEDDSRNNALLALLTFGEGWHNNHHHAPGAARQGFRWWEIDLSWYALRALAALGIVWDLRPVPERALARRSAR